MNALEVLAGLDWWFVAGWTMLHYLWLGLAVGLAAGVSRLVLRRASAQVRYGVAVAWLVVLALLPAGIAVWVGSRPQSVKMKEILAIALPSEIASSAPGSVGGRVDLARSGGPMETELAIEPQTLDRPDTNSNPRQSRGLAGLSEWSAVIGVAAAYLPWVWIVGAPLTFLMLATGVVGAERLRRKSRLIVDGPIAECAARVAESLRIGRRVTLAVCERVAAPVLVGIVRPMILLPPAALTGWSPDEIEMVLLHELAHVWRWDNLVNLLQRLVEAALFFQPAVWLVSNWVRRERESCCDSIVVGRTNRPQAYAELLVALAAQLPRSVLFHPAAASAMASGPLRGRIRRILGIKDDPMLVSGKSLGIVMSGLLLAATLVVLNLPTRGEAEERAVEDSDSSVSVAEALDKYRQVVVGYDLDFDSVFPDRAWTAYEADRLRRYPTPQAWPDVLGHIDTDPGKFREVRRRPDGKFEEVTGGNAFFVPLHWSVGTKDYTTLLFLKGIEADAHVVAHSYTSFASFGTMAGDVLFKSYATALVDGDLTGQITADSYFNLVVTGKFTGRIYTDTYAMVYLMGGLAGEMELDNSKVFIAGRTERAALERIKGTGKVFLEESDLPAGEHKIGGLAVTVKAGAELPRSTSGLDDSLVPFVVGASRFDDGDSITITNVRGTSKTFEPGGTYWITGTYSLNSRARASLAANVTAKNVSAGRSIGGDDQAKVVERGSGEVTLKVRMPYEGWPHVSFYPAEGGQSFAGVYFGTGDSVLKEWWGKKERTTEDTESTERDSDSEDEKLASQAMRSKFVPGDGNALETKHYIVADAERTRATLGAISADLSADASEPRAVFLKVWSGERTRLKVVAPREAQQLIKAAIDELNEGKWQAATQNNLKDLMLGLLNYESANQQFPARAQFDASGKPLLSWRVLILPYLDPDHAKLYEEFHLDEPWNSEHNRQLIARMPQVFKNPRIDRPGMTNYLAVVGEECMFDVDGKPVQMRQVSDGTANTIALVEADADRAVEWTKPEDWEFDRERPTAGLGGLWPIGWYAAWVDGHIRTVSNEESSDSIGIQFTRAGGETQSLSESAGSVGSIVIAGTDDGKRYGMAGEMMGGRGGEMGMEATPATGTAMKKFPSLEEQKLADLIWRRLRLELEPLSETDAKRVEALGYAGGVMVKYGRGELRANGEYGEIMFGDILVGLHVWPTPSLQDVATVLGRDDLGEFSPLKFYTVRANSESNTKKDAAKDIVLTGRISIPVDRGRKERRSPANPFSAATATQPPTAASAPTSPFEPQPAANGRYENLLITAQPSTGLPVPTIPNAVAPQATVAPSTTPLPLDQSGPRASVAVEPSPTPMPADPAPRAGNAAEPAPAAQLRLREERNVDRVPFVPLSDVEKSRLAKQGQIRIQFFYSRDSEPCRRAARLILDYKKAFPELFEVERIDVSDNPESAVRNNIHAVPTMAFYHDDRRIHKTTGVMDLDELQEFIARFARRERHDASETSSPPELRYDGKTFDQWRRAWDVDGMANSKLEALAALEAFARAGFGPQAAAAIAYGVYSNERVVAQQTRKCLSRLSADDKRALAARYIEVLKMDLSAKRRTAAARALAAIGTDAAPALDTLKRTLASADPEERIASAAAIKMIVGKDQYQKPVADVLGEKLGITVVDSNGVWGALPREDAKDDGKAFAEFTEAVIREQQQLFPDGKF